jgi:hypothetical protein
MPPSKLILETIEPNILKRTNISGSVRYDVKGGRQSRTSYKTYEEAVAEKRRRLALQAQEQEERGQKRKAEQDAFQESKKRKDNVETYGNDSNMEREFCQRLKRLFDKMYPTLKFIILNDGTKADVLIQVESNSDLYLLVQIKTTQSVNSKGSVKFRHVRGYEKMPVACFCQDTNQVWIAHGTMLDQKKGSSDTLTFVAHGGTLNDRPEVLTKEALTPKQALKWLVKASREKEWTVSSRKYASWSFKSIKGFKERVSLYLFKWVHPEDRVCFPKEQNGPFDLVWTRNDQKARVQSKTAHKQKAGVLVSVEENAGSKTKRAYAEDSFDVLVVFYVDYKLGKFGKFGFWKIEGEDLKPFFRTDTYLGRQGINLHAPVEATAELGLTVPKETYEDRANLYTRNWFQGVYDLPPAFPAEAEEAGAQFLKELRGEEDE